DGGTDIAEVSGHFGGSDPTDSTSVLSSIVGTIIYETNENGIFYVSLTPVAEGINDLMFNSADRTISSASGRLPSLMAGDILEVTGTASNNGPFTVLEVVAPHTTLKVIESILDESPADTTVMGPPLLVSLPPNQRSFAITNLPSDVHVLLEAFLDSNGNAERDDFIDPSVTYNGGKPLLVGPGGRYNIVLDLSLTPLRIHPDEVDVKGVVTKEDEITGGYHHTITWKSVPGKIYQVRYSTATPAGPFSHYVTARTGLAEQVIGKAGGETTSLIHFSTHRDVFYRIEQLNADGTLTQEADSDGDGLTDYYEEALLLDPFTQDVDLDGMPDGWEVLTKITTHARDIRFNGSTITSVYSLTSANKSDISFAGNIISATSTEFPEFLAGHQLLITGSGKNDGTYILESVSDDRKTLTLSGTLEQEVAGATVTISSVGGTNLSIYPAGIILNVKGSTNTLNDGIFEVKVSSANQLNMVNATNGTDHVFILEDQDPEAPHYITLFASDADIDADIDGLSNLEEYLGADIEGSTFDPGLLAARVFDGDYTNATELDTDADTMDDGWERKYGLNPNALNGVSGTDLGFRGLQIKSISSIPVSGRDFTFNSATNRITALSTSLSSLQHARQLTILGSGTNDGTYTVLSVDTAGAFIDIHPSTPIAINQKEGNYVTILGDREILGNDISLDSFSIRSTPTQVTGKDIHFDSAGFIRSLLGVFVEGQDIGFVGNQISSHFGLTTGAVDDDISFDSATSEIRSAGGNLPNFVNGFQIQVAGSNFNNGTFTVVSTITSGFTIQVAEALFDEPATNNLLPGAAKTVTIDSIGGTDFSSIPSGFEIFISGSGVNDGVQTAAISTSNILTVLSGFISEAAGANVRIEISQPTDFSNFRIGQEIAISDSRRNDGDYIIGSVSPNMLKIQFNPTIPSPLFNDPANVLTEASVTAVVFSDLSTFQKGEFLQLNGSTDNSGVLRVSPFFNPTPDELQVLDLLVSEPIGSDLEFFQLGHTDLSGFNDGDIVLVAGSIANNGIYTLAQNGVTGHGLTFKMAPPFAGFVTESAGSLVSISKDLDNDGLSDVLEYVFKSNPTIADTDNDGDSDLAETNARFYGSDPQNNAVLLTSLNGTIEHALPYEGADRGTVYVVVQEQTSVHQVGDLQFSAQDNSITSTESKLPFLVAGRKITIAGSSATAIGTDIEFIGNTIKSSNTLIPSSLLPGRQVLISGSGDNDGIYTVGAGGVSLDGKTLTLTESLTNEDKGSEVSVATIYTVASVITPGTKIIVSDNLADELPSDCSFNILPAAPEIVTLPVGVLSYSVDGLPSGSTVSIHAYLDADKDGEYDAFVDPYGEYSAPITLGKSPRYNLNITLRQSDLTLANVSPLTSATNGFANAITWNSIPGKIYRILYSDHSPAGPYDKYVESLTGFPQEIIGRFPDPISGISQTYIVHISEHKDTWYRLEMISEDRRTVTSEVDSDSDGLTDYHENNMGLDPQVFDSDGDSLPDGWETYTGLTTHGSDISFTAPGTIRSIAGLQVTGTDLKFIANTGVIQATANSVDFSDFIAGQKISITGSLRNDGTYSILEEPTTSTITVQEQIYDEDGPLSGVLVASVGGTNLSVFPAGAVLTIINSARNDGTYKVSSENTVSSHTLVLESDTLVAETHDESSGSITIYASDKDADPDGDGLTNLQEFLGPDGEVPSYDYALVTTTLFSGDWSHPVKFDTDGDGIDDGWEVDYGLNPNKIDQLSGKDISLRGDRVFSMANIEVSGVDISLDHDMNRLLSTFPHFKDFSKGQLIRIEGTNSNDGSYHIKSARPNEIYLEEPLTDTEPAGSKIVTIIADISITSSNLAIDENSIYSATTSAEGGDITFSRDRVQSLHDYAVTGTDLIFRDKQITSTSGLKYLVHEAAPRLFALRGAEMTTEDGLTLNFVENQRLIMRNLTVPFVDYFSVRRVQFGGEKITFNTAPPFNQSPQNIEWTEIFTEPGTGTDLSLLVPGLQIQVSGSQFNDGVYTISDIEYGRDRWVAEDPFGQQRAPEGTLDYSLDNNNTTTVLTVDTPTLFNDEATGREITITVLNGTDLAEFRTKQEFEVSESYSNNGVYTVSDAVIPTSNQMVVHDHIFKEEPRLLATDLLVDDISFQPVGEVAGNPLVPQDGTLIARHPVFDVVTSPIRFSQSDLEAGGRGRRLNVIEWSTNLLAISDPDPATDFDDIYFQNGDVISGTFEVFPADPILMIPAVTEPRIYVVVGVAPITDPLNSPDFTTFVNNTNAILPGALVQILNSTGPVTTVFEPNAGRYELGEVVYDDTDGNYYMAFAGPTTAAAGCTEISTEWIPLGPTPPHMGVADEFSSLVSYDPGALVQFENHIYVALEELSLNQGTPTENTTSWIEPSLYMTSSLILSHTGAIPKLVAGTKINVYVQGDGANVDHGGSWVDWPLWALGDPDPNAKSFTVKNFISPFMIEVEESVIEHDRFHDDVFTWFFDPLSGDLIPFLADPQPPRNIRLFVNSYSTGQNPQAKLDLVRIDLSAFQPGQKLTIIDSSKNNGVYTISDEAVAVADRVYLQEPLYIENDGSNATIFQSGATDLSGFSFGSKFILGGSDQNDGKFTVNSIKPNSSIVDVSRVFTQEEVDAGITTALATEATGRNITMGIDTDDDSLSNNQEYTGADGISPNNPGDSSDATAPTLSDFDRDGYADDVERGGYFGGSKAWDINSIPSSISGKINYTGTLDGEVILRILEGNDPNPAAPNDISFTSEGSIIRSSSGSLPLLLPGEKLHIQGTILTYIPFNSNGINTSYTVKEVVTQGSEITVEEALIDTPLPTEGLVFLQLWGTPELLELNLGASGPYTVSGLPSHKSYIVDAFLDVGIKVASSNLTFDPDTGTITANTDLFTEFAIGQTIRVTGSEALPINDGSYTLTAVTGTTLTVAETITTREEPGSYIIIQGLGNGVYDDQAEPYGSYIFPASGGAIQLVSGIIPISHLNNINIELTLPEPSIFDIIPDVANGKNTVKWNSIAGKTYRILYSNINAVGPYNYVKTLAAQIDIDSQRATLDGQPFEWDLNNNGIIDPGEDINENGVLDTPGPGDTIDLAVTTVEGQSIALVEHFIEGDVWYRVEMENGTYDIPEQDTDADGLSDFYENLDTAKGGFGTVFDVYDSDGDGMSDGWEIFVALDPLDESDASVDADGDGLSHLEEYMGGDKVPAAYDYTRILTDVFSGDWTYSWNNNFWAPANNPEVNHRTLLPADTPDTDFDGFPDGAADPRDSDSDPNNPGMRDGWEVMYSLNPNFNDRESDPDNDGWDHDGNGLVESTELYSNIEEYLGKDGGAPVLDTANGLLLSNGAVFTGDHTNPQDPDSDLDSYLDGREADIMEGVLFGGSDPNDPTSTLMHFTGSLTSPNGPDNLRLAISDDTTIPAGDVISGVGAIYKIADVPTGNYVVYAFEDKNANGSWDNDTTEPARSLGGHGNPTKASTVSFAAGSPVVILDFELDAAFVDDSVAPTFAEWAVTEGLTGKGSAAELDADGDGIPNFVEFAANTGPLDPDSKPEATFHFENTLGGLLEAEEPGFRMMTVSHPWNGVLAGQVAYEIQVSEDLNLGWRTLTPGDGLLQSLSLHGDRIEAKIRCADVNRTTFTRFVFKEAK
ncbi:MAG: hypothetical protein HOD72_03840, partial [Opitutae bacterium]|nr:hypothetical protein [Opitutae bacterium]